MSVRELTKGRETRQGETVSEIRTERSRTADHAKVAL
jgi:hypothetical protein